MTAQDLINHLEAFPLDFRAYPIKLGDIDIEEIVIDNEWKVVRLRTTSPIMIRTPEAIEKQRETKEGRLQEQLVDENGNYELF